MNYIDRHARLLRLLALNALDALLIKKRQNISYLTGIKGDDAILFFSGKKKFLITDARYKEEYIRSLKNCQLIIREEKQAYLEIKDISRKTRSRRVGFESCDFSYSEYSALKKKLKGINVVPVNEIVDSLRVIKDRDEIRCIKKACKDGSSVMDYALKVIHPSISEVAVKNRIETYIAKKGMKRADFDIIVASGKNSSMPHAAASAKRIKTGQMVVIDLGIMNYGYNSDLTRTVFLGRIDRKYSRIYNIVLDAQKRAIEKIRPGISASYIDMISRQYISDRALGRYFVHNLGHGVGLEIHERPHISRKTSTLLKENMVMTIEPGVYIPGWGGVRIEDICLVTKKGCQILTGAC
ncbi:MAG: aminopeptidase P family protein [Candidatus Omnitrophota bacterium]